MTRRSRRPMSYLNVYEFIVVVGGLSLIGWALKQVEKFKK